MKRTKVVKVEHVCEVVRFMYEIIEAENNANGEFVAAVAAGLMNVFELDRDQLWPDGWADGWYRSE